MQNVSQILVPDNTWESFAWLLEQSTAHSLTILFQLSLHLDPGPGWPILKFCMGWPIDPGSTFISDPGSNSRTGKCNYARIDWVQCELYHLTKKTRCNSRSLYLKVKHGLRTKKLIVLFTLVTKLKRRLINAHGEVRTLYLVFGSFFVLPIEPRSNNFPILPVCWNCIHSVCLLKYEEGSVIISIFTEVKRQLRKTVIPFAQTKKNFNNKKMLTTENFSVKRYRELSHPFRITENLVEEE